VYYSTPAANLPCRNCTGEARAVHVNGFDLYYREVGTNTTRSPFVVVHGGPGMSSQTFKKSFDFLTDEYRVIYYDQRDSGNSQIKPDTSYYTIDLLVEELETFRSQVIGADKIILVGHSAGGALFQRYAIQYSQHVNKMILVGSRSFSRRQSSARSFWTGRAAILACSSASPRRISRSFWLISVIVFPFDLTTGSSVEIHPVTLGELARFQLR
jgi:pimeloyl-ACP methyl ester carboxylesterase